MPAGRMASTLKSSPIWSGPASRSTSAAIFSRGRVVGLRAEPPGAFEQAHAEQEFALRRQMGVEAVRAGDCGKRAKVDMAR